MSQSFDLQSFTPEQRELLLDVGQLVLDVVGVVEPTPFADASNAVISIWRGQWGAAAISAVAIVPWVGDLAKLSRLPQAARVVERAVAAARADARFAAALTPLLQRLRGALDALPAGRVPAVVGDAIARLRRLLDGFLPRGVRTATRLDRLTEAMLVRIFGSARNVGALPRRNVRTVVEFLDRHKAYKVEKDKLDEWAGLFKGIDLHAADEIVVTRFKPGDLVAEYVQKSETRPGQWEIGQWMTLAQGAVSHRNVGLSDAGRVRKVFRVTQEVEVLKSTAAAAADHWTRAGAKPHMATAVVNGKASRVAAVHVAGGGDQYFLPGAWKYLVEVPGGAGR